MADSRSILHQGQVSERDVKSASARVAMDDFAGHVSGKMQVLFPAIGGWNMFYTPKEGDHVVMSRLPNGQEEGYVLGKVYTGNKMPQGGEPNILLLVSDDGKNVVRFDADKGTLDLIVDQDGELKFNNLTIEVKEHTGLTTDDLDIESEKPIGLEGTKTQLGANVLQVFWDDLIKAWNQYPAIIPAVPWPPGLPVPPAPPIINMALNGIRKEIIAAATKAKESCAKTLK